MDEGASMTDLCMALMALLLAVCGVVAALLQNWQVCGLIWNIAFVVQTIRLLLRNEWVKNTTA